MITKVVFLQAEYHYSGPTNSVLVLTKANFYYVNNISKSNQTSNQFIITMATIQQQKENAKDTQKSRQFR